MKTIQNEEERWLNPQILKWARDWSGKSLGEAAAKLKKSPEQIAAWERDDGSPTVKQARTLADFYGRPFLEFFLSSPPSIPLPKLVPDFRMHAGLTEPALSRELIEIQQWAETQRDNALDLLQELAEQPAELPKNLFASINSDPGVVAQHARAALGFTIEEQLALDRSAAIQLPNILRRKLEGLGVLTLRRADLKDFDIRGICIAAFPLPVIVFRTEAPTAQGFTLAHEFAHILLRESGITGPRKAAYNSQPIERWCDRFAAAFLMPEAQIEEIAGKRPRVPAKNIADEELNRIAARFRVSPHAMLIRLVHLGYVQATYYWDVKKPQFDAEEREYRSFGRPTYYGSRYRTTLGDLYTGLVLEAWQSGRITNHNAAEYMGIKNLDHLHDIRKHFSS